MATVKNEEVEQQGVEPAREEAVTGPPPHGAASQRSAPPADAAPRRASGQDDEERDDEARRGREETVREAARTERRNANAKAEREKKTRNNVRKIRMERMMSKAELARRAAVSTLTIDRVERGLPCRMDTKRKILEALGLNLVDRVMVFGEDD